MSAVERLIVESNCEKVKTPIMSSKFLLLKYLDISLVDVQLYRYDYFSLVSFLEASPALETFMLRVGTGNLRRRDSVLKDLDKDQLHLRQMPECLHYNLKNVMVTGFSSAKSLIELTNHIVGNALALASMTLDTARGCGRRTAKTTAAATPGRRRRPRDAHQGIRQPWFFGTERTLGAVARPALEVVRCARAALADRLYDLVDAAAGKVQWARELQVRLDPDQIPLKVKSIKDITELAPSSDEDALPQPEEEEAWCVGPVVIVTGLEHMSEATDIYFALLRNKDIKGSCSWSSKCQAD
ncbi:hypothetical protein C2845_PMPSC048713 [Panicum miliaceum]|uniref:At1g61320/AtMIF1 LRR domain-containing protein n=1 Tax=Panicum miliaceum TaxID=4540 RepID=A0A3L6PBZ8_PANMI|nr:hypothetical protein C2845_PMPSC048713 [Panicum miliaceum]